MKNKTEKKEKKRAEKEVAKKASVQAIQPEQQKPISGAKKAVNVITKIIVAVIALIAVAVMIFTIVSVTTFDRNDRDIFGYHAYIVNTDSMSATDFDAGDLIITKQVDPATLQEGDIISYISQNSESYGETITHKILEKTEDANGAPGFITYGTTTGSTDETIVTYEYITGKYQFRIPKAGTFFNFLRTPQGYIVCIFIPFMLLIIYQGVNCIRLFRRYKNEQMAEIKEEKAKIQSEREESAKMMAEMMALKAQLQQQQAGGVVPQPTTVAQHAGNQTPAVEPVATESGYQPPEQAPMVTEPAPVQPAAQPVGNQTQVAEPVVTESGYQPPEQAPMVTETAPVAAQPAPVAPVAPAPVQPASVVEPAQVTQPVAEVQLMPAGNQTQVADPVITESGYQPPEQAPMVTEPATPQVQSAPPQPEAQQAAEPAPETPASKFDAQFADLSASMDAFFEKFLADTQMPEIKIEPDAPSHVADNTAPASQTPAADADKTEE